MRNHNGYILHPTSEMLQIDHKLLAASYLSTAAQSAVLQTLVILLTEIEKKHSAFEGSSELSSHKQISSTSVSSSLGIMTLLMIFLIEILQGE